MTARGITTAPIGEEKEEGQRYGGFLYDERMRDISGHMRDSSWDTANRYGWTRKYEYSSGILKYMVYSLDNVNLLHQRVTHVSAVQCVVRSVEAAPERVSQPVCAYLGQCVCITVEV